MKRKAEDKAKDKFRTKDFGNISNATFGRVSNNFGLGFCC